MKPGCGHHSREWTRNSRSDATRARKLTLTNAANHAGIDRSGYRRDHRRGIPPRVGWPFLDGGRGTVLFANRNEGIDAVYFEAEMIDALLEMIALYFPFGSDGNDGKVEMTVGQISGGPHPLDNLEIE